MKTTYFFLYFILLSFFASAADFTGPSYVWSEIKPISINKNGDILCRTRYTENPSGGHYPTSYTYGYCILTKGNIVQYISKEIRMDDFSDEDFERYNTEKALQDSIFESPLNKKKIDPIGKKIIEEYGFSQNNVNKYKSDKIYLLDDFERERKVDLGKNPQKALNGALSNGYIKNANEETKVHILYDFGNILILENYNNNELEEDEDIGASFDYKNPFYSTEGADGEIHYLGFDISHVTGVIFLNR